MKLNAPYKEIPSIYAVLCPQEKWQIIRINKVFLGEGDANQMAQVADSVNYPEGELRVTLTHSSGETITFRDSVLQTVSGAFSRTQRVYVSSEPVKVAGEYTLTVKNNRTENVFTARSWALDSVKPINVQPFSIQYSYENVMANVENPNNYYVDYNGSTPATNGENNKRYPTNNSKIYQFSIRAHYYDSLIGKTTKLDTLFLDYNFVNQYITDAAYEPPLRTLLTLPVSFTSKEFFAAMGIALKNKYPNGDGGVYFNFFGRKFYKIQYFIYSSTQDYWDYLQYASPSLSISQNKPLYSNFDNQTALGIFTFRARFSVVKAVTPSFKNEFANNANTRLYRFMRADNKLP